MIVKLFAIFPYLATVTTQVVTPKVLEVREVEDGEYPYVVALLEIYKDDNNTDSIFGFCTGSLIQPQWTLTAAHCVEKRPIDELHVWHTNFSISPLQSKLYSKVFNKFLHPTYASRNFSLDYDICLLYTQDIVLSSYGVLSLKRPSVMIGRSIVYVGGRRINKSGSSEMKILRYGESEVTECKIKSGLYYVLCVATNSSDSYGPICYGDSGGPCLHEGQIVGLCAFNVVSNDTEAVFTSVRAFRNWMIEVMQSTNTTTAQNITAIADETLNLTSSNY